MSAANSTSAANPRSDEPKSLEIRLGLVMYGGVSLAIYINGVAQEFFNAVRGRGVYKLVKALTDSDIVVDIISGTSAGGINGIMLAYALCNKKEFTSSARLWRDDGDIRRLLRSPHGRAESSWSLLNSEGFYQQQLEAAYRGMEDITKEEGEESPSEFSELDLFVTGTDVDGRRFTQFDDAGHPIDVKDHRSVFLLKHRKDRKEPFKPGGKGNTPPWFVPKEGEPKAVDAEDTFRALAKLSRLTSCFPAAFSPVTVTRPIPGGDGADALLQWWGGLDRESVFLDGGLIDNKPFTHTLRAIFYRGATRRVDRRLFYVEPDPEHWEEISNASQPNFAQAIVASLIGIPGYESISDDLRLLATHNSRLERYNRLVESLHGQTEFEPPSAQDEMLYKRSRLIGLSERVMRGILRTQGRDELLDKDTRAAAARMIAGFERLLTEKLGDDEALRTRELTARLRQLDAEFSVRMELAQAEPDVEKRFEATAKAAGDYVTERRKAEAQWRPKTPADVILADFDVEFRLRRLFHIVYFLLEQLSDPKQLEKGTVVLMVKDESGKMVPTNVSRAAQYKKVWRLLNEQIELLDVIRTSAEKVIDDSTFDWKDREPEDVWRDARVVLRYFFDAESKAAEQLPNALFGSNIAEEGEQLSSVVKTIFNGEVVRLRDQVAQATADELDGFAYEKGRLVFNRPFRSILAMIDKAEADMLRQLLPSADDPVRKVYEGFPALDAKLYAIDLIAELHEKDIIKTVRVSPFDARRGFSNKGLSDKVSGDALYHFGGFFKRSWRSNDILWGRLDGLCQLVETLISRERLEGIAGDDNIRLKVRDAFYRPDEAGQTYVLRGELSPRNLFPYGGELMWGKWEEWLGDFILGGDASVGANDSLTDAQRAVRDAAIKEDKLSEMVELLVEAAQLEIIKDDVPEVINDALQEQIVWNQFRIPRNSDGKPAAAQANGAGAPPADGGGAAANAQAAEDLAAAALEDPFVFAPPPADLDAFVGVFAAEEGRVRKWIDSMQPNASDNRKRPLETRLGKFFRERYTVGAEVLLRDVPMLVLLEILSVSLLVLRNCVLEIFGDRGARVKGHPLYLLAVDYPLRAFYLLVRFLRRAPRWEKQVFVVLALLAVLLLLLSWFRWSAMIMPDGEFDTLSFAFFVIAPLLVLYSLFFYIYRESYLLRRDKVLKKTGWKARAGRWLQKVRRAVPLLVRATLALLPLGMVCYLLRNTETLTVPKGGALTLTTTFEGEGTWVYLKPELMHPYLLVAACVLALFGPFLARAFLAKGFDFLDYLRDGRHRVSVKADALRDILQNHFRPEEIRAVGQSLLVSTPFEWKEVSGHLVGKRNSEIERLKKKHSAAGAAEKQKAQEELDALTNSWKARLDVLENQFGSYRYVKWGTLRAFMEQHSRIVSSAAKPEEWGEDLRYLTGKLGIPEGPNGMDWPYVAEVEADAPAPSLLQRARHFRDESGPPRTEAERRERLAREILNFANDGDRLTRLAGRMRFINPEALYGE